MNDLRAKLAALFRRCTSPDISDEEAAAALKEFRSLGVTRREIDDALGVSDKPTTVQQVTHAPVAAKPPPPANEGPRWPFKKKHAGELISHIARTDPDYLRYFVSLQGDKALREPLLSNVKAALAAVTP